jgi:hypothetical protein
MKKFFLSLSLLTLSVLAIAQNQPATARTGATGPSFYFGGGPAFSKFTGDLAGDPSILVGAQVAMGMSWKLGNSFAVVPELNVAMQGTKWDDFNQTYRLWYLNLPVVARYQFGQSGLFVETGPQIGLLLDAQRKLQDNDEKDDISESFKNTSINWNFGVGFNIGNSLSINARVAPGLTDIDKDNNYKTKQLTSAVRLLFGF